MHFGTPFCVAINFVGGNFPEKFENTIAMNFKVLCADHGDSIAEDITNLV